MCVPLPPQVELLEAREANEGLRGQLESFQSEVVSLRSVLGQKDELITRSKGERDALQTELDALKASGSVAADADMPTVQSLREQIVSNLALLQGAPAVADGSSLYLPSLARPSCSTIWI